ncbi:hypothetical protein FQA39_LY12735 [Lamprigera yunnana]|nr:hypothetical protein FQA39_LY12735 [Lamprigera yunnana]
MAYNYKPVLLGFEDEYITDKHKGIVNFATNKIGGKPDWPSYVSDDTVVCSLCQLPRPLVLQIYAPLDDSSYHRTLYLFACINANCWNQAGSWTCIRIQSLEQETEKINLQTIHHSTTDFKDWCHGADEWDDDDNKLVEENGNLLGGVERTSDEDEESCSTEESVRTGLGNLTVDDQNANLERFPEARGGGAVGRLHSPRATAEIEGDEGEIITIDSPTFPQVDLTALLQEVTPLPQNLRHNTCSNLDTFSNLQFVPCFLSVWEEAECLSNSVDGHAKELLLEYQQTNDGFLSDDVASGGTGGGGDENYEKSTPAHGDKMFHYFLTKIQNNPGQILRYSRDGPPPVLLQPLHDKIPKCEYCDSEMIFEFQVLPTLISKLRLNGEAASGSRLEFGTVLIFTCRKSCWATDTKMRKEFVILQTE